MSTTLVCTRTPRWLTSARTHLRDLSYIAFRGHPLQIYDDSSGSGLCLARATVCVLQMVAWQPGTYMEQEPLHRRDVSRADHATGGGVKCTEYAIAAAPLRHCWFGTSHIHPWGETWLSVVSHFCSSRPPFPPSFHALLVPLLGYWPCLSPQAFRSPRSLFYRRPCTLPAG